MELTKQYGNGKGSVTVEIGDSIQNDTHSGPNIQAVLVLRYDGNIDIWSVPGKQLRTAPNGDLSIEAPKDPMEDKGVRVSNVVSMSGTPSRIRVNGTVYYWEP